MTCTGVLPDVPGDMDAFTFRLRHNAGKIPKYAQPTLTFR
jgi:hypothetical protein